MAGDFSAEISRRKQYVLPGQNRRFAWKWIYTIRFMNVRDGFAPFGRNQVGEPDLTTSADTLYEIRDISKRLGVKKPVELWKKEDLK